MATITINNHTFTLISKDTKKAEDFISDYNFYGTHYGRRDIYTAYDRPSSAKVSSFEALREKARDFDLLVYPFVGGASSHFYSVFYKFLYKGKEYLVKETHANSFLIEL